MSEPNELMKGYDTKAIHGGHEFDPNSSIHSEIVPSIVTSMTFYQPDPTNITVETYNLLFCAKIPFYFSSSMYICRDTVIVALEIPVKMH